MRITVSYNTIYIAWSSYANVLHDAVRQPVGPTWTPYDQSESVILIPIPICHGSHWSYANSNGLDRWIEIK